MRQAHWTIKNPSRKHPIVPSKEHVRQWYHHILSHYFPCQEEGIASSLWSKMPKRTFCALWVSFCVCAGRGAWCPTRYVFAKDAIKLGSYWHKQWMAVKPSFPAIASKPFACEGRGCQISTKVCLPKWTVFTITKFRQHLCCCSCPPSLPAPWRSIPMGKKTIRSKFRANPNEPRRPNAFCHQIFALSGFHMMWSVVWPQTITCDYMWFCSERFACQK